jgi:hypothetical protein
LRINKIAAGSLLSVMAAGSVMLATATPAGALGFATAVVAPNTNLVQGQSVAVSATGFPAADAGQTMYVFECASQALTTLNPDYCDTVAADTNNTQKFSATLTDGKATGAAAFTILTGSNFHPTNTAGKCGFDADATAVSNTCYVTVADTAMQTASTTVGFDKITFKDPRAATTTTVSAPKTAKAGKTITLTIATTKGTAAISGSVAVTDKGNKVATVKESSTGSVTVKEKHAKAGTHKFVATYSGDSNYRSSKGKAKTKVK